LSAPSLTQENDVTIDDAAEQDLSGIEWVVQEKFLAVPIDENYYPSRAGYQALALEKGQHWE